MAHQDPGQPITDTSYSDPIYDRLESFAHILARNWLGLVLFFLLSVGIGLLIQYRHHATPDAASAARFTQARHDRAELAALLADEQESAEFRARAAVELAQLDLTAGDGEAAIDHAQQGLALLDGDGEAQTDLALSLRLSQAAGYSDKQALDQALEILRQVEIDAERHPAHRFHARLAQAEILYRQAGALAEEADTHRRRELLQEALAILEPLHNDADPGRAQLRAPASYLYLRIRQEHPELVDLPDRDSEPLGEVHMVPAEGDQAPEEAPSDPVEEAE